MLSFLSDLHTLSDLMQECQAYFEKGPDSLKQSWPQAEQTKPFQQIVILVILFILLLDITYF